MGIFNKIRGGAGSDHYSGRNDYPYQGNGAPAYTGNDFANEVASAPKAGPAPVSKPAKGTQRYNVKGGGGDYLRVTPSGDDKYDVTRFNAKGDVGYSTKGARFGHDSQSGKATWGGGTDHGGMGGKGMLDIADGPYAD